MLQICGISICKPLEIIFRSYLSHGKFPEQCKKANVIREFKKGDKQCVRIVSLKELYIIIHTILLITL